MTILDIKSSRPCISWESALIAERAQLDTRGLTRLVKVDGLWSRLTSDVGWESALRIAGNGQILCTALKHYEADFLTDLSEARSSISEHSMLVIADDIGSTSGLLMDPITLANSLFCYYEKGIQGIQPVAFHSDGDIEKVLPALRASGFSHVHLAGIDLPTLARLCSGASSGSLIPIGGYGVATADAQDLPETIRGLVRSSSLIFADDAGLTEVEQVANFLTLSKAITI